MIVRFVHAWRSCGSVCERAFEPGQVHPADMEMIVGREQSGRPCRSLFERRGTRRNAVLASISDWPKRRFALSRTAYWRVSAAGEVVTVVAADDATSIVANKGTVKQAGQTPECPSDGSVERRVMADRCPTRSAELDPQRPSRWEAMRSERRRLSGSRPSRLAAVPLARACRRA